MAQPDAVNANEGREPKPEHHDDEVEDDDAQDGENVVDPPLPAECANCQAWYKQWLETNGILGDIFRSPYYFALAFFVLGLTIQASVPLVSWQFLWFFVSQLMLTFAFGGACFITGVCATAQYKLCCSIANLYATSVDLPTSLQFVE